MVLSIIYMQVAPRILSSHSVPLTFDGYLLTALPLPIMV